VARAGDCDWVALDFETATSSRASACAVGLVYVHGGRVSAAESFLIRPPGDEYFWFNTRIHGIDAAMTRHSSTFAELWPALEQRIAGRPVVAHNASFDMSVLRHELDRAGLPAPDLEYFCTLVLSRACWPQLSSHRLPDVASHCGITFRHHDAAEDARACAEILLALAGRERDAHPRTVAGRHGVRPGRLSADGYQTCSRSW
jgi:DNA polymerase III subunit epsilon